MDNNFKEIFQKNYSPLCNYAYRFISNRDIVEDIVQDLFVHVWESNKLISVKNKSSYLLQATKYRCFDYLRTNKTRKEISLPELPDFDFEKSSELKEEDIEPLLHYFASKLPPKTRQIFLMSRQSKMTYKEIAEDLNLSIKTVEAQMSRSLRIMKSVLKEQEYFVFFLLIQVS